MNAHFSVRFGTIPLGQTRKNVPLLNTKKEPTVQIDPEGCYTLIMIDPDAGAGRGRETGLYFLHWLVMNISGGALTTAKTIVDYFPPSPPSGKHDYIFQLYKQDCSITYTVNRPVELSNWNLNEFVKTYGLVKMAELTMRTGQ